MNLFTRHIKKKEFKVDVLPSCSCTGAKVEWCTFRSGMGRLEALLATNFSSSQGVSDPFCYRATTRLLSSVFSVKFYVVILNQELCWILLHSYVLHIISIYGHGYH